MTTPDQRRRPDPRIHPGPPLPLSTPGAPPAAGWSRLPVADRLIYALERLVDLNEDAGRITAIYRESLQQPTRDRRVGDRYAGPGDEIDRDPFQGRDPQH